MNIEEAEEEIPQIDHSIHAIVKHAIEVQLAKQIDAIPDTVNGIIGDLIAEILGVTKRNNKYYINNNSNSSIMVFIKDRITNLIHSSICKLVDERINKILSTKSLETAILGSVDSLAVTKFAKEFDSKFYQRITNLVDHCVNEVTDRFKKSVCELGKVNTDIEDPDSFAGMIGEAFIKVRAAQLSDENKHD